MNTNQMARNKESNLSATANKKRNNGNLNNQNTNASPNKSIENKNTAYINSPECSGGVCSTDWKPVQH